MTSEPVLQNDPEVRKNAAVFTTVASIETPTDHLISYFSDWKRLLKAVAWYLKVKNALMLTVKKRKELSSGPIPTRSSSQKGSTELSAFRPTLGGQLLTVEDLSQADRSVITDVQKQSFPVEMAALETAPFRVQKSSKICRLDPILDEGIMRVGGRLHRSVMPDETKHPSILPKDAHTSDLLLRHIHERSGHSGRNYMLSELRKKYWVLKGNSVARKIVSKCDLFAREVRISISDLTTVQTWWVPKLSSKRP